MQKKIKELNYDEAIALMKKLCNKSDDVAVFVDRGWGDSGQVATYEIITNGNGQKPLARITEETCKQLREKKILGGNTLITYKARKVYPFLNGKKDKSTLGDKLYKNTQESPVRSFFNAIRGFK